MSSSIIAFVVVLGILIFFHELGHFLLAKLFGVGVEKFSLGFGPRIFGRTVGRTDYRISAIPLGGYVKMVGEEPDAEIDPGDLPYSFTHKHVLKRILIVAAGPAFNMILAVLIFFMLFMASGRSVLEPVIGTVQADMPAAEAGLQEGDRIVAVNDREVRTWEEMSQLIKQSGGEPIRVRARREGQSFEAEITPQMTTTQNLFGEDVQRRVIGITAARKFHTEEMGIFESLGQSVVQTYRVAELTIVSIVKLIQGTLSTDTLGGPIMIAQMAGEQAREGMTNLVFLIALLSVNLAILNILPIPVLDGGHLLFFCIELVSGRPVNTRIREIAQQAGLFVLMMLMIFVFYNDIVRILTS
jgi:regulator of sigma E protease